jgi:hypothetical protein
MVAPIGVLPPCGVVGLGISQVTLNDWLRQSGTLRYGMQADRNALGVHAGQTGEPTQKP